ncbi:hypothetical protein GCM10023198_01730 [Promicromonospora umidemergens]|uniref:Uncharacterized protein n=1 Tax=Promicromonospora umidemergens TaxID=629679 RepID=A0ABP8WFN8_9MICO
MLEDVEVGGFPDLALAARTEPAFQPVTLPDDVPCVHGPAPLVVAGQMSATGIPEILTGRGPAPDVLPLSSPITVH